MVIVILAKIFASLSTATKANLSATQSAMIPPKKLIASAILPAPHSIPISDSISTLLTKKVFVGY